MIHEHEELDEPTREDPALRGSRYRILKCAGCERVYFQLENLTILDNMPSDDEIAEISFEAFKEHVLKCEESDPGCVDIRHVPP